MTDIDWLAALAASQGLALAGALLGRPAWRTRANRCLAGALLALAVNLFGDALPGGMAFGYVGFAFVAPLVFLHVDATIAARRDVAPSAARPHLLGVAALLLLLVPYLAAGTAIRRAIDDGAEVPDAVVAPIAALLFSLAVVVQQFAYLVFAARRLGRAQVDAPTRDWLRLLLAAAGMLWFTYVVTGLVPGLAVAEPTLQVATALTLQALAVLAMLRPEPFVPLLTTGGSYQRSRLANAQLDTLLERVAIAMRDDALFRNPNLDLARLARAVNARPNDLSQALSQRGGRNFYDVVGEWRIRAACDELADPAQADRTVLDIAFDVRFNSKSVFHDAFRRFTGSTPGAWRRKALSRR